MKFQYLGTAAAEGIPALFCECETCRRSRAAGGRALRTRSQVIIDDTLLIDFPADTYAHMLQNGLSLLHVTDCLITHTHSDHLYTKDIDMLAPGFSHADAEYQLRFYGSDKAGAAIRPHLAGVLTDRNISTFTEVQPFTPFSVGKYTVTALPAIHDQGAGPLFYMITDGDKTVLYAHDTHYFADEVWAYWEKEAPRFDLVSLDCTNACLPLKYVGHMGLTENIRVRNRMLESGLADNDTRFVCNHFSHNGTHVYYDDFVPLAAREGFLVSYDGMQLWA